MNEAIAKEYNLYAYSNLILSCKGVAFSIVDGAKTTALPNGDARIAWIALKERYQVENAASKVELKRQFTEMLLKRGQNPDEWFLKLDHLRNRLQAMKSSIQDEDYVAHVLSNLMNEYSELVTVLEGDLEGLAIQKLRERVRCFYRRKQRSKIDHCLFFRPCPEGTSIMAVYVDNILCLGKNSKTFIEEEPRINAQCSH